MRNIISRIYPYAFFILVLAIPFDEYIRAIPNIMLAVLAVSFPFVIKKSDFQRLNTAPVILFLTLVIFLILNALLANHLDQNFSIVKKVFLSLVMVILYLPIQDFKKLDKAIIISVLVVIAISLYNIIALIINTGAFEFGNTRNPLDTLILERLYIGLLSMVSILVSFRNLKKPPHLTNRYYWANIIINVLFIFLIVSRIAIITLVILVGLRLLYGKIKLWKIGLTTLGVVVVFALAYNFNENIEKRFLFTTANNADQPLIDKIMLWEPRTKIWECAYIIAQDESSFLKGLGFETTREKLVDCYDWNIGNEGRREWFLFQKYNTHNQFFDFYLSTGIFSALLFLAVFVALFIKCRSDYFSTALLVSIFLFGFVENFFHRQIGSYYFGIILILLLFSLSAVSSSKQEALKK